jgi:hypothetical protein
MRYDIFEIRVWDCSQEIGKFVLEAMYIGNICSMRLWFAILHKR